MPPITTHPADEAHLARAARSLNRRLGLQGSSRLATEPCPPIPGVFGRPYQICLHARPLTLPLSWSDARTYLEGADRALDLRENQARRHRVPAPLPAAPLSAVEIDELAGCLPRLETLNARLELAAADALAIAAEPEPVAFVAGRAYTVRAGTGRLTIPLSATAVYLYLEGMTTALDLEAEAVARRSRARRRPERTAAPAVPPSPANCPRPWPRRSTTDSWSPRAAPATRRAYTRDLDYFWAWVTAQLDVDETYPVATDVVEQFARDHLRGLPAATDRLLVSRCVKAAPGPHRPATVVRRLASLSAAHRARDLPDPCASPTVRELLAAATKRHTAGGAAARPSPASYEALAACLASCAEDLPGRRDSALLLLAWACRGLRPAALARMRVEDLRQIEGGFLLRPQSRGTVGPALPVLGRAAEALAAWMGAAGLTAGPLFRAVDRHGRLGSGPLTPYGITSLVTRRARRCGLSPASFVRALRSGFGVGRIETDPMPPR
jgi:integrase